MPSYRHRVLLSLVLAAAVAGPVCDDPQRDGRTVLRVANWGSPAVESDFMRIEREIWGQFERLNPGVRLQIEQIPGYGQYAPKLIMQHVAGVAPDVISLDLSAGADFINNDLLLDLRPLIEADPEFRRSDYFENLWKICSRGERIYAVPLDFTPMMMFYNKRLFDRAGLPYPREGWTWQEFLETAQRLTVRRPEASRPSQFGYNFENWMPFWVCWLWSNGGDVLSPDGRRASGYLDGEKSAEAIQFLADLILQKKVASHPADRAALGVDFFLNGLAALDMKGHWMLIDYRARGLDVGVTTIPTNIGRPTTVIYVTGLSIMKQCKRPDLAWKYIKYATSEAVQVKRVASGLAISGNARAAAHYAGNPIEDAFLRAVEYARAPWGSRVENYAVCEDFGTEMMENILYGHSSVPQALREAAKLMDAALYQ